MTAGDCMVLTSTATAAPVCNVYPCCLKCPDHHTAVGAAEWHTVPVTTQLLSLHRHQASNLSKHKEEGGPLSGLLHRWQQMHPTSLQDTAANKRSRRTISNHKIYGLN
jgi:hypothetical protein